MIKKLLLPIFLDTFKNSIRGTHLIWKALWKNVQAWTLWRRWVKQNFSTYSYQAKTLRTKIWSSWSQQIYCLIHNFITDGTKCQCVLLSKNFKSENFKYRWLARYFIFRPKEKNARVIILCPKVPISKNKGMQNFPPSEASDSKFSQSHFWR